MPRSKRDGLHHNRPPENLDVTFVHPSNLFSSFLLRLLPDLPCAGHIDGETGMDARECGEPLLHVPNHRLWT